METQNLGKEHYALYQLTDFLSSNNFLVQVSLDPHPDTAGKIRPGLTFITRESAARPAVVDRCMLGLDMLYEYLEYKCSRDLTDIILMTSEEAQELTAAWKDNQNAIRESISGFYGAPNYTDLQIDVLSERLDARTNQLANVLRRIEGMVAQLNTLKGVE